MQPAISPPEEPTRPPGHGPTLAILRAADELRRRMGAVTEPLGITTQQYNVLRVLREVHPRSLPTLSIGDYLIERTPGTTRLLERLAAKKLVRRERPAANRRVVQCWITPAGLELLERLDAAVAGIERVVDMTLGDGADDLAGRLAELSDRLSAGN